MRSQLIVSLFAIPLLLARPVAAQDQPESLKIPTLVYTSVATTDASCTYYGLTHYRVGESNPLINRWQRHPATMLGIGGSLDASSVYAWNRFVGRTHPRVAAAGLYAVSAYRMYLVTRWAHVYETARHR